MNSTIKFAPPIRAGLHQARRSQGEDAAFPGARWRTMFQRISDRDRAEFCIQLSVMLKAKVSLQRSLEVVELQMKNQQMKLVVSGLIEEVQKGNTLAHAFSRQPGVFDMLFIVSAEVGQESGRLADVFTQLAQHLENISSLKRRFLQAMTYPALVVGVASLVVMFFLLYIVPTFAEMFKSFQLDLPATTKALLLISRLMQQYGMYLLLPCVLLGVGAGRLMVRPDMKEKAEALFSRTPFLGDIILKNHVARFCRTLGTLLHAQVLLVDALATAERMMTHKGLQKEIGQIIKQVRQGNTVSGPLIQSKLFPPMVAQMIAVGEETSELDQMLFRVADFFENEIQTKVDALASIAEPILIMTLGIIVGGILVSLYLPMFDVVNSIGG